VGRRAPMCVHVRLPRPPFIADMHTHKPINAFGHVNLCNDFFIPDPWCLQSMVNYRYPWVSVSSPHAVELMTNGRYDRCTNHIVRGAPVLCHR
jgi:hypothetical protein